MRKLTAADYVPMPWKNGGGSTTQLAVSPSSAGLDNFDWRISTAQIATGGPFSFFPGVDRSLAVLRGRLSIVADDEPAFLLTAGNEVFVFRGEQQIETELPDGPLADFNVMTRRARCEHALQAIQIHGSLEFKQRADQVFAYIAHGSLQCRNATGESMHCDKGESLLLDRSESARILLSSASATVYIARITFKDEHHVQ
ncbi:MAG TPA: HutD family protein [Noviherbaspirillum sp.]|uniref:HutD/Ves family protein n=1 Tax=Noviherbaspirillum sp. TaxID=1926288 RepID=UPI002B464512|nr:HutD family protein [Noviherbaspirillum sp.]HJV84337.1 HutD family protein [Noviherbaspirillum sp.]